MQVTRDAGLPTEISQTSLLEIHCDGVPAMN